MPTEWPKHPDGSNMLIGEMAPDIAKALIAEASARSRAKLAPLNGEIFATGPFPLYAAYGPILGRADL